LNKKIINSGAKNLDRIGQYQYDGLRGKQVCFARLDGPMGFASRSFCKFQVFSRSPKSQEVK
jgi:hypothetical protein